MFLGGLPDFNDEPKKMGAAEPTPEERIKDLEKQVQWMKWALILLTIYVIYQNSKK